MNHRWTYILLLLCFVTTVYCAKTKIVSIPYGATDDSIGCQWEYSTEDIYRIGVAGIKLDRENNIVIGDPIAHKVKTFSSGGRKISATEGEIGDISAFTPDLGGNLFVYDRLVGAIKKYDCNGKLLWSKPYEDIVTPQILRDAEQMYSLELLSHFGGEFSVSSDNELLLEMHGWDATTRKPGLFGILLDSEGNYKRFFPFFGTHINGLWYGYETSMANELSIPTVTVKVYNSACQLVKSVELDTHADNGHHYQGVRTGIFNVLPEQNGYLVIAFASRIEPMKLSRGNQDRSVGLDVVINRYNPVGKFVKEIRMNGSTFNGTHKNITIDSFGNVVYLNPTSDGVDIELYD